MEEASHLTCKLVGLKAKSKKEMYRILASDAQVYLPPMKEVNYKYIRGILTGGKKFIKHNQLIPTHVLQTKSLSVKDVMIFAKSEIEIDGYLPEYKRGRLPNRVWFINLVNTLLKDRFSDFVDRIMSKREKYIFMKKNFDVDILPEFANIFLHSKHVSSSRCKHGRSHYLVRSARKRKYEGKTAEELLEENKDHTRANKELSNTIRVMKRELENYNEMKEKIEDQNKTLAILFEKGVINNRGQLIEDSEE